MVLSVGDNVRYNAYIESIDIRTLLEETQNKANESEHTLRHRKRCFYI